MTAPNQQDEDREFAEGEKLPFTTHLEELRSRLIKCLGAVIAGFAACYSVSEPLFQFFVRPLIAALPEGSHLAMLSVQEGFVTHIKIALLAGVILACPVIFFQVWRFVAPGLYAHEKRYVWPFVGAATVFFLVGANFAYWVVFPFGFQFLLGYAVGAIQATISIDAYLGFATKLMLAFGAVFELPVVVYFLTRMGVMTHEPLARNRGYALVVIAVISAVLTPPDVFTMGLMMVPLYLLFEISIIVARIARPHDNAEPEFPAQGDEVSP